MIRSLRKASLKIRLLFLGVNLGNEVERNRARRKTCWIA
ncbi:MAG: hypothetical protein DDT26_01694 [Dehalococcoidia bacterium]|nr:hypothetical protein [Chloroflexota bacterium]